MVVEERKVNIIGAGIAGLSCAIRLAESGIASRLISRQASERAQSVLAEGGINAALDTMGEGDSPEEHIADTIRAGCGIASEEAVRGLCESAPELLRRLWQIGVPFHAEGEKILLRNFGGQKKKRTAYAKSSSGKAIMTALIDEARKYEAAGIIERFSAHELCGLRIETDTDSKTEERYGSKKRCEGVWTRARYDEEILFFAGPAVLCTGGLNGLFVEQTTGTTANDGAAAAIAFDAGVAFSNLEMIQYHPTTVRIAGKCLLISEAARGEGGRLYVLRRGEPWHFMEEKYPELGNLMPRDVVSREMARVLSDPECEAPVFLDMRGLSAKVWKEKLPDLRAEITEYLGLDPAEKPIPVEPGIHFFMGGVTADVRHETNISDLYAAGEAAAIYHGANRLGGNSLLGALYGGRVAAESIAERMSRGDAGIDGERNKSADDGAPRPDVPLYDERNVSPRFSRTLSEILLSGLGIEREEEGIRDALRKLDYLEAESDGAARSREEKIKLELGRAMLLSALERKESRGAHFRNDYPEREDERYGRASVAVKGRGVTI